jgi:hypothetical protein
MSAILRSITTCSDSSNVRWLTNSTEDNTNFTVEQFTIVQNYWTYISNLIGYQSVSVYFPDTTKKYTDITFDTIENASNALIHLKGSTRDAASAAFLDLCQTRSSELGINNKNLSGINLVD